ncbi:4'-phosphopantetheinyl transferase superfamily protein [Corynebacterium lizhenjunii]|uniref:4'-phosphopantetheinyl transferase superfamily protein n=1 Tax=Corynebacterium lizhenjunii TaxID=2709394 RepID=A0A7T0PBC2_9CORY|nr:4'-phosphopantetheinyl transferase superfamily protein [Corynebacterium lizhenjunii]QPK78392.1 4'-phosphopantetheinyl transferase superfamily protein [Corynebacterium lizhenjunii]
MIQPDLFPPAARFCYVRTQPTESGDVDLINYRDLHPLEKSVVSQSVDIRKSEFGDARWCAHQALKELGVAEPGPILRGERGMPLWPEGFVGSITHTSGFRAAVAAPQAEIASMGLDAEPAEPLPDGVFAAIARSSESRQMAELRAMGMYCPDRLLFCAKEATYKAWFPLTQRWLGFDQAEIDLRPDGTLVSYILARPTPVPFITGRWMLWDGYIVVSTVVPDLYA